MENLELDRWVEDRLAHLTPTASWQPDRPSGLARLRSKKAARRRARLGAAASAAMLLFTIAAFPATRVFAQRCLDACVGETSLISQYFRSQPAPGPAPDFTLPDASGHPVRLSSFQGKVVLLNFWATWCPPCRTEVPWFQEFHMRYGGDGFVALGVSVDESWQPVRAFLEQTLVTYPVMVDSGEVAGLYGHLKALPATLLIDRKGRIVKVYTGLVERAEYERAIERLLD